jgi:YaiO family outer membrane protein
MITISLVATLAALTAPTDTLLADRTVGPGSTRTSAQVELGQTHHDRDFGTWTHASLALARREPRGTALGRVRLADRFGEIGVQGEVELYPRVGRTAYGFAGAGVGTESFPGYWVGAEAFLPTAGGWEFSLGGRRLGFEDDPVDIVTGSASRYHGAYLLMLRPYVAPRDAGTDVTVSATARRYLDDEHWVAAGLSQGVRPPETAVEAAQRATSTQAILEGRLATPLRAGALTWRVTGERERPAAGVARLRLGLAVGLDWRL